MKKRTLLIFTSIVAVMVFAVSAFVYEQSQVRKQKMTNGKVQVSELVRMHSPVFGTTSAKVTIVEFFDPACETCRAFYPRVKELINSHEGKVKLVIRYAPFHEGSEEMVKILEASKIQNKYWPTLETVLRVQPQWAAHDNPQVNLIWSHLEDVGLDIEKARQDMSQPTIAAVIEQDKQDLRKLEIAQTPTFFVNGKSLPKFGYEQLKSLVDQEVKTAYP